jgi:hypothetical protein
MTQDEIIEMAREAGCIPRRHPEHWEDIQVFATPDVIVKFAKLVAAKALSEQERNFCSRCGKRTKDLTHIHTCTPPQD